jgi:sulfur relay (sulfurtransferase) DsrC/TusE family protein
MKLKKRPIKYKKERVILSDILPYEIPITFSNRHFYDFLISNQIEVDENNKIKWDEKDDVLGGIIKLLFDFNNNEDFRRIPFNYKITHKEDDFRELTVIHPKNQIAIVAFYKKYKELILYHCTISPFSIRRPIKIANFKYFKDKTHFDHLVSEQESESIEEFDKEYENLKTFFVYKDYSNIHKFFESNKFHECEKKYNKLFKFDISKCFDSIYTHTVSWALLNKDIVKNKITRSDNTFPGKFDILMRDLNYGETNGIVIGPELSRIFAELILQKIDSNVANILEGDKYKLIHKTHYEVFRYVDDYFVFYNNAVDKDNILKEYRLQLKEYKLYINDSKTLPYEKPIITEITIAKLKITDLLDEYLSYNIKPVNNNKESKINENPNNENGEKKGTIYVSSNKLITKFKIIIKETKIDYKDILNFTLAVIERKLHKIIKDYNSIANENRNQKNFTKSILEILEFTFFLYSVSPRVNTTIKLCRILRILTEYLNSKGDINNDLKHLVFKKIFDNIYFVLQKNKSLEHTQVETLYLLIALRELGEEYWLDINTLCEYFNIIKNDRDSNYCCDKKLNYFTITVLLFYIKNERRYNDLKIFIQNHILKRFENIRNENVGQEAELVFLLFDILSCPYLENSFKREILVMHGITDSELQISIIIKRKFWFTKWTEFDFGSELDAKKSQEVY